MSKHLFFMREHISRHVLENDGVPLNPFMIFNYFLGDTVNRDVIRKANNSLVTVAEQLWMYGPVSDGALAEIIQAKKQGMVIRYFGLVDSKDFVELSVENVVFEENIKDQRAII